MKILKNTTGSDIELNVLARGVPASSSLTVEVEDYLLLGNADSVAELTPYINSGDIVVNDGNNDLTTTNAIYFIQHPDAAFNVRFLSPPQRANLFDSRTVQEAIEEVGTAVAPLIVPINLIHNGTLSNGEFIGYSNLLPGDNTPIIAPINGIFTEFTWSNRNSSADFALEFRKNTLTGTAFFTWSVDNTKTASVYLTTPEPFTAGDEIYVKYIDQGSNASDAAIVLGFKS